MPIESLSQERIKKGITYNPDTGEIYINSGSHKGQQKTVHYLKNGAYIWLFNKRLRVLDVIWKYCYGENPSNDLIHKNGDVTDNRLCNIKEYVRIKDMPAKKSVCLSSILNSKILESIEKERQNIRNKIKINCQMREKLPLDCYQTPKAQEFQIRQVSPYVFHNMERPAGIEPAP